MKAQYTNFIGSNVNPNKNTSTRILNGMLALRGLAQRDDVQFLQAMVSEYYPQTMGLKALDLSSGRGVAAMALAELGFQVVALDMHRNSISIVQKMALKQELNISFGVGGTVQMENILPASTTSEHRQERFDLIHDTECLTNTPNSLERARFLTGVKNAMVEDGTFVLKTSILSDNFDPEESFESICLDENHILWRQTPASDAPGVIEMNGKHWTAQKRIAPPEFIRGEVIAAGFKILVDEIENPMGNNPATLRLVLTSADAR